MASLERLINCSLAADMAKTLYIIIADRVSFNWHIEILYLPTDKKCNGRTYQESKHSDNPSVLTLVSEIGEKQFEFFCRLAF